MRITNGMIMKRYNKNLNTNLFDMNKTSQQVASGRRFQKGSEDPVRALKALQVRRNVNALEQYSFNIETVDTWLSQTETAIMAVKTAADKAVDLIVEGRNDTLAPEDRAIIATALRSIQEALLKDLNTQVANKYLLGGVNTKEVPFTVDPDTGHLMFNGEDVFTAESLDDLKSVSDHVYVDLTGEFKLDGAGEIVDKSTVFDMYTPGVNVIGVGPNNLYNLIGRIADAFESEYKPEEITMPDGEKITINADENRMADLDGPVENDLPQYGGAYEGSIGLFQRLQDAQTKVLVEVVKVGEKANFVSYLKQRTDDNLYDAQVMQSKLEVIPPDEAILNYKMQDYVYKACLQMSSYIFQPSLMDYLRK